MSRRFREFQKWLALQSYTKLDRFGVHLLPKHYYSPVPDRTWLLRNKPLWTGRAPVHDVHWDLDEQLGWLESVCAPYYHEVRGLGVYQACRDKGPGFGPIESQVLHCFLRSHAPARVIEIGSGASTCSILHAVELNCRESKIRSEITCIEPHPRPEFRSIEGINHLEALCQEIPLDVFAELADGDLLFIDSSHAVKIGSDVVRTYLHIIPSLKPGVIVHIHDIFLPYLYSPNVLHDFFGWQETSLLLALLTGNLNLRVQCCLSALHYDRTSQLETFLLDYRPRATDAGLSDSIDSDMHFPSSIWLKVRNEPITATLG